MKYLSTTEAAQKWGISIQRMIVLAKDGRIPGATQIGMRWMIPENAEKPADGRTKAGKAKQKAEAFRYPLFEGRDIDSFEPPLNEAELRIKQSAEAFHACRFEEADRLLGNLPESTKDPYHRIYALYAGCMIDGSLCNFSRFYDRYGKLRTELQKDFPYKLEMRECLHQLDASLGENDYYANRFRVIPGYKYHESFLPRLACLSAVPLSMAGQQLSLADLKTHELNCIFLENMKAYTDLQSLHIYIGCAYAFLNRAEETTYHFEKALSIAEKHHLYYVPAVQYFYMRETFEPAISGFPEEFIEKMESLSKDVHERFLRFTNALSMNSIYKLLTHDEYIYLFYAVQGYSNREVANQLQIPIGSIGKEYRKIYATLGVKNRKEMLELYALSVGKSTMA